MKHSENLEENFHGCLYWSKRNLSGSVINNLALTPRVKVRTNKTTGMLFEILVTVIANDPYSKENHVMHHKMQSKRYSVWWLSQAR